MQNRGVVYPPAQSAEDFRYQELVFIGLNACALTFILAIHLAFIPWVPATRSVLVLSLLVARTLEQGVEAFLLWKRLFALTPGRVVTYSAISMWVNIGFAFTVSILSNTDEAHFVVLLMVPLIQACFRYRLRGVIGVALLAMGLNFIELWTFYVFHSDLAPTHKPLEHQFELATTALIYPFIGVLVHILVRRVVKHAEDLSETLDKLQSTQQQLVQKEKLAAVGQLVNVISHELRHPVAVVSSALDAATRNRPDSGPDKQFLELASEEIRRLDKLTKDLLAYARPKEPEKRPTSALMTLNYLRDLIKGQIADRGPNVVVCCEPDFLAPIDPYQMHQALLNLATNAVHFTCPDGVVTLGADTLKTHVDWYVENTGEEIPPGIADHMFEPFFTTRNEGSGLGLAISKKIAESHGGSIRISRNRPGQVRFTIRIPVASAEGN